MHPTDGRGHMALATIMNGHSVNNLLLGFTRSGAHAGTLKMAYVASASIHSSAARENLAGADLSMIISENILAAGIRYLKEDEEKLIENLQKRNAAVNFDHMVSRLWFINLTTITDYSLPPPV